MIRPVRRFAATVSAGCVLAVVFGGCAGGGRAIPGPTAGVDGAQSGSIHYEIPDSAVAAGVEAPRPPASRYAGIAYAERHLTNRDVTERAVMLTVDRYGADELGNREFHIRFGWMRDGRDLTVETGFGAIVPLRELSGLPIIGFRGQLDVGILVTDVARNAGSIGAPGGGGGSSRTVRAWIPEMAPQASVVATLPYVSTTLLTLELGGGMRFFAPFALAGDVTIGGREPDAFVGGRVGLLFDAD